MDPFAPYLALQRTAMALGLSLGLFMLYLRFHARPETVPRSIRWALTLLGCIFLVNASLIAISMGLATPNDPSGELRTRLHDDVNTLVPFLLIVLGVIFPRPRAPGAKVKTFFVAIAVAAIGLLLLVVGLHALASRARLPMNEVNGWVASVLFFAHLIGWFLPIFLWMPDYEAEPSVQVRLVLTLLVWGFLAYPLVASVSTSIFSARQLVLLEFTPIWPMILVISALSVGWIMRSLWRRRGAWQTPERVHVGFIVLLLGMAIGMGLIVPAHGSTAGPHPVAQWFLLAAPWAVLRPSLFAAALLRFQVVTPDVRIDRGLSVTGGIVGAVFVSGVIVDSGSTGSPGWTALGIIVGAIAAYPCYMVSERVVRQLVPATRAALGLLQRQEARALYQLSLQSAVFAGKVDQRGDEQALEALRQRLGVSEREHKLLLTGLWDRDAGRRRLGQIRNVFLMTPDGRLISHIGPESADDADQDIVAGMLTAIRTFVAEGFQGKGELETVKFGDQVLAIEARGPLVIAAGVVGADLPEIRQTLGDWLALLEQRHRAVLENWNGNMAAVAGVESDLWRLLRWSRASEG